MGIELANPFTLPEIQFIGGDSLSGSTAFFSIIHYSDRFNHDALPVISREMEIKEGASGMVNVLAIKLTSTDTVDLHNKYIYQITLITAEGDSEVHQGIMMISRNVDGALVR